MVMIGRVSIQAVHLVAACILGVLMAFAIAGTAAPWTKGHAEYRGVTIDIKWSLWRQKAEYSNGAPSRSETWADILEDHDRPACSGSATPTQGDLLARFRVAQAGSILSILATIVFVVCAVIYASGKVAPGKKWLLLLPPAATTLVFALMAYGGYTSAYNACDKNLCESWVDQAMANGFNAASCGPSAGPFLFWAAVACGVAAFVCLIIRPPSAYVDHDAAAAGQYGHPVEGSPVPGTPQAAYGTAGGQPYAQPYTQPQQQYAGKV